MMLKPRRAAPWLLVMLGMVIAGLSAIVAAPPGESPPPRITKVTATSFLAEWATWPQADGSTHYQLRLGTSLYGKSTLSGWTEVRNLTPGAVYPVAVLTYHRGSIVDVSSSAIILTAAPTPRLLKAWDIASTAVTISWEPVTTAIEYRVLVDEALVTTINASDTRVRLTGFNPGQVLSVTVIAVNQTGASSPSKPLMVHLTPAAPALKVEATEIGQTDFILRWEAIDGAASYTLALGSGTPFTIGSGTLEWRFTGLTAGASYTARIVALSLAGIVSKPGELVVQMIPPTPPVPQARSVTNSSFILAWAACRGATRYKVFYAGEYMLANVAASFTEALCRPFGPGEVASMTVVASNESGDSPQSPVLSVTLTGTPTRFLESLPGMNRSARPTAGATIPLFNGLYPMPLVREVRTPRAEWPLLLVFGEGPRISDPVRLEGLRDHPDLEGVTVILVQSRKGGNGILPTLVDDHGQLARWLFGGSVADGFCFLDEGRRLRAWGPGCEPGELAEMLYRAFPERDHPGSDRGRVRAEERARFQRLFEVK